MYTCAYGSFEKGWSETSVLLSFSIALKCLHGFRWFLTTAKGSPQCSRLTLPQCEVSTSAVTDRPSVQPPMTRPSKWVTLQNTASLHVCVCVCVCVLVVRVIECFRGCVLVVRVIECLQRVYCEAQWACIILGIALYKKSLVLQCCLCLVLNPLPAQGMLYLVIDRGPLLL